MRVDDVVERRERHLAEIAEGARRVEQDGRRVVGPERPDLRLRIVVQLHRPHDRVVQLLDRDVLAGREVVGAAAGAVGRLQTTVAPDRLHEQKSRRASVTKQRLPSRQPVEEDRQRPADVARPDYVGQAESDPVDAGELDVVLAGGLRDRVAAIDRIDRVVEADRLLQRLGAVAQRGLEIDQPADLVGLAGLGDVGAADGNWPARRPPNRPGPYRRRRCGPRHRAGSRRSAGRSSVAVDDRVLDQAKFRMRRANCRAGRWRNCRSPATSSPRASNMSVTVEPTWPEPPVTNTFIDLSLQNVSR